MTGFEVNAGDPGSRFETDGNHSKGSAQAFWAQVLPHHFPLWLNEEIRQNGLTILDWGCGGGDGVDSLRSHFPRSRVAGIDPSAGEIRKARLKFGVSHFAQLDVSESLPVTFDVLVTSNLVTSKALPDSDAPWKLLSQVATQVSRHLVVLVPYGESRPGQLSCFDESTIGTLIEPDFFLSSSHIIRSEYGARILLVYSRPPYLPRAGAAFGESSAADIVAPRASSAAAATEAPVSVPAPADDSNPIETIILPQLRNARSIAIVTCAIPFSAALNQRPVCCAKYLADRGVTVLFVELWQCPEEPIHRTGEEVYPGVFCIPFYAFQSDIHYTFQDNFEAIAAVPHARKSYVCTLPTREMVAAARRLREAGYHIHYDIMDDWAAFFEGDQEMTHWFSAPVEMEMLALADTVSAVSRPLVEKFRRLRSDIAEVRNGYQPSALDCAPFSAARAPLETPKTVGYFGHFADAWFDWETLLSAARDRPDLQFELIGYGMSDRSLLRLYGFPNIRYVGLVPQKDLRRYAEKWWAAMIPFQSSTLSAAVDPLKVYEYLHFGLPVVVTGIPSLAHYPMVQLAADAKSFVTALDRLPDRPDEQSLAEVREFLESCLWEARLSTLDDLLGRQGESADREARESALRSDTLYLQSKSAELEKRLERQIRQQETEAHQEQQRLQEALWEQQRLRDEHQSLQEERRRQAAEITRLQQEQDAREAEIAAHEAMLQSQVRYWQDKVAGTTRQLDEEREERQETVRRFQAAEEEAASEKRALQARVDAGAYEAANLRRLTADLLNSRSWKITAPLRFLSKPLFRGPGDAGVGDWGLGVGEVSPGAHGTGVQETKVQRPGVGDQGLAVWEELRRAQSIAIIPCAVPFRSSFSQRPISFAKYLADRGTTVLYVVWQWSGGGELPPEGTEVYPRIFHLSLSAFQSNLERIASATPRPLYLCSLPSPALVDAARPLRAAGYHIHYDIMDDWEEFHSAGEAPWYSAAIEREMVMLSDTVTAVSAALAEKFARLRRDIAEMRNGYDPAALGCRPFLAARAPLEHPKTIGYFGHLSDAWFDWETLYEAARKLPEVQWELLGYGLSDRSRARLAGFPNIRFSGLAAQNDLSRYAHKWWAAIIPFRPSTLSAAVDPLKIYEYLHFGLPTVATGVSGIARYPLVDFASDRDAFVSAIDRLQGRPDEKSLAEAADFLKACTWEARLEKLDSLRAQPSGLASLYAR